MVAAKPYFKPLKLRKATCVSSLRERRRAMSGDGTRFAQHLADVGDVGGLGGDLRAGVFLEHDVAPLHQPHELVVLREPLLLVRERLAQDLVDVVLVGLQERAKLERGVATEARDVLAGAYRVGLRL